MKGLVVGGGSIGTRHLQNLVALGLSNMALVEPDEQKRENLIREIGVIGFKQLDQGLSWEPDFVVIATPTHLHAAQALDIAREGFHMFIEKPLAHSFEYLSEIEDEVRRQKLITLVGCNLRFHPGLIKVKQLLEDSAIGQVVAARVEVGQYLPDWHPDEDYRNNYSAKRSMGGGIILDAIHEIDYIRWMLGEVQNVVCFAGKLSQLEIDTEDTAAILLRFSKNCIGEVHMDYIQRVPSRTCHIIGEDGTIRWNFSDGEVRWYLAKTREWNIFTNYPGWEPNQMYLDEMRHFLRCINGQEKPTLDVFQGKRVVEIALSAKCSAKTGQVVSCQVG